MFQETDIEILNTINFNFELLYEIKATEYMAAYRIQQWWYKITMSPYYKVGRKFIEKKIDSHIEEYNEMIKIK